MAADLRAISRTLKASGMRAGGYGSTLGPYISQGQSPLVASYNEWASGHAAGTSAALPREWATFLSGAFGPLAPIQPVPIDVPTEGDERPPPRRFQYPISWNMPMGMPGTEGLGKLADFQTLRTLADLYSVARACIDLRKSELRAIGWNIALTKEAAKALRGSHKGMREFAERRAQAVKFFRQPDPRYGDFSSWFDAVLEEVFVTDALAIYIHPSRMRGRGLLGSSVGSLDLIDGTLIKPLVSVLGDIPAPPNPAFQQFLFGVPRVDLTSLIVEESASEDMIAEYRADQLLYLPYTTRTWTPYGQAPIERAIIPVMAGLNRQQYQLNFFQEGSIPGLFVSPGDTQMTPQQIRELQDALNAVAGDQSWKHKIIVLPGGSRVEPQKPAALADQFDEIIMTQVCMAFSVMPMELGISPRVSATQSVGVANQMAKSSQDIQERKGTVPLLMWMKAAIFDRIIQDVCGHEDMEWQWEGLEEDEDVETLTSLLSQQISVGLASVDEGRIELGRDPWNLPVTSDPGWATPRIGFVPFTAMPIAPPAAGPAQSPQQPNGGVGPSVSGDPATPGSPAHPLASPPAQSPQNAPAGTMQPRPGRSTPAHSASTAGAASARGARPTAATRKAQLRELDLLGGHLRKGGTVAGWERQYLPGHVMAVIEEDLTKGLTAGQATGAARDMLDAKSAVPVTNDAGHGDRTHHVYAYLGTRYPAGVLEWVKTTAWHGPASVPLASIDMTRRPGGARNETKVAEIAAHLRAGGHVAPLVLVKEPGGGKYEIVDGWHRTLAAKHAGLTSLRAYTGDVGEHGWPGGATINRHKLNKTVPGAGAWAAWGQDRVLAAEHASALARRLISAVSAEEMASQWRHHRARGPRRAGRPAERRFLVRHGTVAAITALMAEELRQIWDTGWQAGRSAAGAVLGVDVPPDDGGLHALAHAHGQRILDATATRVKQLEHLLRDPDPDPAAIETTMGDPAAATTLAQTELTWAISQGAVSVYRQAGVPHLRWEPASDAGECESCARNQAAGPVPAGQLFPSGQTAPPDHPNCRCCLLPSDPA